MPRYIDAERMPNDAFWEGLTDTEKAKVISWMLQAPAADVAPRAEVAREIFAEIEKEIERMVEWRQGKITVEKIRWSPDKEIAFGFMNQITGLRAIGNYIDGIKYKYTEGEG